MLNISKNQCAILYMLVAMFCLSAMNVALRMLSTDLHSTQIVVLRHICSIVIVLVWSAWLMRGIPHFYSKRMSGHFWRATFGICAMEMWFYSISIMNITLVTALSFITPIFSTILAIIFLGEKAGIRRWGAVITGFIGMLIILRPDISGVSNAGWIVIGASILMAGSGVMVKSLTSSESPETIVFYMSLFMLLWSIPIAIPYWQTFNSSQFAMAFIIALCSTIAHLCMARAFVRTELVVLAPFDFTRLIFTAVLAYIFFGETVDAHTLTGSAVIVASAVYIAHREAKKKKIISPIP
jgi:drug/metabolite transporter (DMT)-like permease